MNPNTIILGFQTIKGAFGLLIIALAVTATPTCAQSTYTPYAFTNLAGLPFVPGSDDGTGSAARFYFPSGVAVDSEGNIYVADHSNYTIRKITPAGAVTTLAGSAGQYGSADGTGSAARFNDPTSVAVDSAGNLYVSDLGNSTIRKITPAGTVTTLAGSAGQQGSADGTGNGARFAYPRGTAVDSAGNVYVADQYNNTIRKVTPAGAVTTLAGSAGQYGSADGTGSAARFTTPIGVAVDSAGNVYVGDYDNHTIRKITPAGVVTTVAGLAGYAGSADGTGSAARFYFPRGVAVDTAGNVYVADEANDTIRKITPAGVVTTLAGLAGYGGSTDGFGDAARFHHPYGVAVDSVGNAYVADAYSHRITKGTPETSADTIPPTISFPADIVTATAPGQCSAVVTFRDPAINDDQPGATVICNPPSGSVFFKGTSMVTCIVTDASGNTASCAFGVTVKDTEPPAITCSPDIVQSTDTGQCSAVINYTATATDNCSGVTGSCNPPSGSTFPKGTTTVTCTAKDASGNTAICSFTVTVNDNAKPTITCPANITVPCSIALLVPVTFSVTASDNCDPSATVTSTPASGSGFPVGTTAVTSTARDASGNISSCSFKVTRSPLGFAGFLPPIGGADVTGGSFADPLRTFKLRSTIPVKFSASCGDSPLLAGIHTLQAIKWGSQTDSDPAIDATPTDAATTGNQFRLVGSEWHFNLDTKATGMTTGVWQLIASLSDSSQHTVWIQLK